MSGDRNKVYEIFTNKILAMLDEGTVPWRKPWTISNRPRNLESNRPYTGINLILLAIEDRTSPYWLSFKQLEKFGGRLKEDDKASTIIIFWKIIKSKQKDEDGNPITYPMLRFYKVWNLDQTVGVKIPKRACDQPRESSPIEAAEAIIAGYAGGPKISSNGSDAHYNPATDKISVPSLSDHDSDEEYYSTLLHELVHSTGHKDRLNRNFGNYFGDHAYGREELVAEIGSAFLCNEAGISHGTIDNQAAYIAGWKAVIKADVQLVVKAAAAAQKAADHILGIDARAEQEAEAA